MTAVRSKKYRDGSRGQQCTLRIPGVCTGDVETTIFAHIRDSHTGRGVKASDLSGADACFACHDRFDGRSGLLSVEDWLVYALRGLQETQERRVQQKLLRVDEDRAALFHERASKPRKPAEQRRKVPAGRPLQSRPMTRKSIKGETS